MFGLHASPAPKQEAWQEAAADQAGQGATPQPAQCQLELARLVRSAGVAVTEPDQGQDLVGAGQPDKVKAVG
ncbi:hypothetical protein F751_1305 [Auxenochlorella protothecoides]|uniref:Uncharacterized protein n=1 Tax=Auxenochlorella protothecoides TaxID=3075 RepID=A0A087SN28_AUXPR|nr:hypothetical protein F751_1305 [Auxenochlorella protothecoides]KFM27132.1 hypothetical protein F751_1305 [Auxenochlorella protothecoides]